MNYAEYRAIAERYHPKLWAELRALLTESLNLHHTVDCQEAEIAELRTALERLNEAATGMANDPQSPYARKEFIEATAAADEALARVRGAE